MSTLQLISSPQQSGSPASGDDAIAADPLFSFAGPVEGSHALVIAAGSPDMLCKLLRLGCAAATSTRLLPAAAGAQRPERGAFDLVVAPRLCAPGDIGPLIYQAKRALAPMGRFLAFVEFHPLWAGQDIGGLLVRSIRLGGFVAVQTKALPHGLLVRADLPILGWANSAPRLAERMPCQAAQ